MSVCKVCSDPLILTLPDDEDDPSSPTHSFPDDLELLACGCHFHWQCLLDQSPQIAQSLSCPSCGAHLAATSAAAESSSSSAGGGSSSSLFPAAAPGTSILVRYTNEGGVQENLDVLPDVAEEAYLDAHPAARPARALHVMCAEGDVGGIVDLLRDAAEDDPSAAQDLLRYQDPLAGMRSGLHLAVERGQEEVVWLLLWLASPAPGGVFPPAAVEAAGVMGVEERPARLVPDVRGLRDARGRTAEDVAAEMGPRWSALLEGGVLRAS